MIMSILEWEEFEEKHGDELLPEVLDYLYENRDHRELWKGVPISRDGKVRSETDVPENISTARLPSDTCIT